VTRARLKRPALIVGALACLALAGWLAVMAADVLDGKLKRRIIANRLICLPNLLCLLWI